MKNLIQLFLCDDVKCRTFQLYIAKYSCCQMIYNSLMITIFSVLLFVMDQKICVDFSVQLQLHSDNHLNHSHMFYVVGSICRLYTICFTSTNFLFVRRCCSIHLVVNLVDCTICIRMKL